MIKPMYYRRNGTPYKNCLDWAKDFNNRKIKIVKQETLPNGYFVSTVWLGIDHSFMNGPPLIFETMVFFKNKTNLDMERYSTEDKAIEGHKRMVSKWKKKRNPHETTLPIFYFFSSF